ncbi:hypothetical protein ACWDO0_11755 [Nocardia rhamnosiphila]|uniref:hypothetical protein n=1 Tax=Nocardia rhamnosiphila TaxID=426716 RepID=UPI0033F48DF8
MRAPFELLHFSDVGGIATAMGHLGPEVLSARLNLLCRQPGLHRRGVDTERWAEKTQL